MPAWQSCNNAAESTKTHCITQQQMTRDLSVVNFVQLERQLVVQLRQRVNDYHMEIQWGFN